MVRPLAFIALYALSTLASLAFAAPATQPAVVDSSTLRGKVMAGYQGWFRCPGDPATMGWVHWSRDGRRIDPSTVSFEMWPDVSEYPRDARFAAPGFTNRDGTPTELFTSDDAGVVLKHFEWMRDYGIDGAWLQHFVVDLPGGPAQKRYPSRLRMLRHVQAAAAKTGRVWALTYDISGTPGDKVFDILTAEWKKLVDNGLLNDPRYLREGTKPLVQIFGFYRNTQPNQMTPETATRLIEFFKAPGPYSAFVYGGGDWDWRRTRDPAWAAVYRKLDAYSPWNVGNLSIDQDGTKHASTGYWPADKAEAEKAGVAWIPVVYPGFSWDNLQRKPAGSTNVPRRKGEFYWEQFVAAAKLKPYAIFVAMFDEVDEGTAIFKVVDTPPMQAHFLGMEGMPSDWYLRLTGVGATMYRGERAINREIPIKP